MTIDPQQLYGQFHHSAAKRDRLNDLVVRKALNLPVDDVQVQESGNTTYLGPSLAHTLLLAASLLLGGGGIGAGAAALSLLPPTQPPPAAGEIEAGSPASQEFRVTFEPDDEGTKVEVK